MFEERINIRCAHGSLVLSDVFSNNYSLEVPLQKNDVCEHVVEWYYRSD